MAVALALAWAPTGAAAQGCPAASGGGAVQFEDCSETKEGSSIDHIHLYTPAGTSVGDLLVAVVSVHHDVTATPPALRRR